MNFINELISLIIFVTIIIGSVISFGYYGRLMLKEYEKNYFILTLPVVLFGAIGFSELIEILSSVI